MKSATGALHDALRRRAWDNADNRAITFLDAGLGPYAVYTYGGLYDRADRLAQVLVQRNLKPGAPVGILLRSQEDQVLHYLAALAAGLVPAILAPPNRKLNRDYYVRTTRAVLARSRFTVVITDVEDLHLDVPTLAPYSLKPHESDRPATVAPAPTGVSFLQFSSGTTGIKRGVLVTDEAILSQLETYAKALGLEPEDRIISWLPLYHDMGFIACLNMPLAHGIQTIMLDPIDWVTTPATFLKAASTYRASLAWNPNFAYAFMAHRIRDRDIQDVDLTNFRGLVNCSEPVTRAAQQAFLERFTPYGLREDVFWGCYAMAETTFALTHGTPHDAGALDPEGPSDGTVVRAGPQISVGQPLPGVELKIVNQEGEVLPDRHVGEIWARSPFTFTGYHNDPEATAEAFSDHWYRTGDLGYKVGEALYVTGRRKDVLIVGGVNVFPQDIEDLVSDVEGVHPGRVSAFSTFDERVQTERIIILAEAASGEEIPDHQDLVIAIRQRVLAGFQIANFRVHIVPHGWLVKSSSGKMSRAASRRKWVEDPPHV